MSDLVILTCTRIALLVSNFGPRSTQRGVGIAGSELKSNVCLSRIGWVEDWVFLTMVSISEIPAG